MNFLILPLVIPLLTSIISLLNQGNCPAQRATSVAGAALNVVFSLILFQWVNQNGITVLQLGNWPAPYGITLVADLFSAIMVVVTSVMGLSVVIYSVGSIDARREASGYHTVFHILLMGVSGAFLTGDIFNMFVWYEVMLISSFVLLALGGERPQLEGGIKYVTLNLMASALFLAAVGLLYGFAGTLNMADLAQNLNTLGAPGLVTTIAMLFLLAFGIKSALFPLFFWLPASYHTPPIAITAILSALLTKVGVYSLIRIFTLIFTEDVAYTHNILLVIAGFTMVTGVLGAVAQMEVRRLLSFHIISQIGYLIMGLGIYTVASLAGTVFFMVHVILSKTALFLISGVAYRLYDTYDLKKLGSLYRLYPTLSGLFVVSAFSLAGIPPFSGFWAKFALVQAGLSAGQYLIIGVSLAVSILTMFSMTKIWAEAFWKSRPVEQEANPISGTDWTTLMMPIVAMALIIILMGVAAGPGFALAHSAAEQLYDPTGYIQAVNPELSGPQ